MPHSTPDRPGSPRVVPYSGRAVLSFPEDDAQMWTELSRDATTLSGPEPEYLLQQLARSAGARRSSAI